jgi:hypothetical protein
MSDRTNRASGEPRLDRRRFTVRMAMAMLGGAAIQVGCGGGSPSSPGPVSTPTGPQEEVANILDNHGHHVVVTAAELLAGGGLTLSTTGSAAHRHTLTLTADDVARIRSGETITKTSSNDVGLFGPHEHVLTFN